MLSGVLAQQIAGETSEAIGYNVIITDAEGIVIGSGDQDRVGSFHEASVGVLRSREPAWHDPEQARALTGVRPGITLPLLIGDEAVGTVGITGSPRQVRRFGVVVRRQTEILLQESELLRSRLLRERALERLVAEIAQFDPTVVEERVLREEARMLGFTLPHPRRFLLVDLDTATVGAELLRVLRTGFRHPEDLVAVHSATRCAVLADAASRTLADVEHLAEHAVAQLVDLVGGATVAVSEPAETPTEMRDACRDAEDTLRFGRLAHPTSQVLLTRDLRLLQALGGLPRQTRLRLVDGELGALGTAERQDLGATIVAWCESGFSLVGAAATLHVHRNTLVYRLEKIERLLGRPWRDHRAMLSAYVAVLAQRVDPE